MNTRPTTPHGTHEHPGHREATNRRTCGCHQAPTAAVAPAEGAPGDAPALTHLVRCAAHERQPPGAAPDGSRRLVVAARIVIVAAVVAIAIGRPGLWLSFVTVVFGAALAWLSGWRGHQMRVVALALAVFASAVDYLSWRMSVISWSAWLIALPLFWAELHAALHTAGLQASLWPRNQHPLREDIDPTTLPVIVFIPTVNEGATIVEQTVVGVLAARRRYLAEHTHAVVRVVVCNDGGVAGADCSPAVIAACARLGVECITRTVSGGAKAGNIEHARQLVGGTGDALLVIFDADQVPLPTFFLDTIAPFRDTGIGWVQTGQFYRNRANPVARWADDQQSLFYRLLCPGKANHDAVFICGTNVVLRAAALDEIGGLPTDSVTEDFAASIMLAPRWRSVYLPGVLATGLGPIDMPSYLKQQERWARGTLTVLRRYWRQVAVPGRHGLRASQRLQYALAITHYLAGLRDLVFVIAPVVFVFTGLSGVHGANLGQFLEHFVPYYTLAVIAFWHASWRTTSWRSIVLGFASTPALLKATWMTTIGRRGRFVITPKERDRVHPWRTAAPYLFALAAVLAALVLALTVRRSPAIFLAAAWLGYLAVMLISTLMLVRADARLARREASPSAVLDERLVIRSEKAGRLRAARTPVLLARVRSPRTLAAMCAVLLTGGATAALVATSGSSVASVQNAPTLRPGHPRIGLAGATDAHAATLAEQLGGPATASGRTFEVGATFGHDWARTVAAAGGVPWVNLVLTQRGKITLNSSLTAVSNGADDDALRGWAEQLVAFGKPVYLTMLSQLDRNFGTSSAVARDGIPADGARAWAHIRALFRKVGATNIAWVWSPAAPATDMLYSPPATQIDAVAVTLYEYPGTVWVDPARAMAAAAARHPGKPLLLEVSAAGKSATAPGGAATTRSAWLARVGDAVAARTDVAALVYHDDGPYSNPSARAAAAWGLSGDPASLDAARAAFALIKRGHRP